MDVLQLFLRQESLYDVDVGRLVHSFKRTPTKLGGEVPLRVEKVREETGWRSLAGNLCWEMYQSLQEIGK